MRASTSCVSSVLPSSTTISSSRGESARGRSRSIRARRAERFERRQHDAHGAASLQEAALDPLLTGRGHTRIADGAATAHLTACAFRAVAHAATSRASLERVGLTGAADRKIRTYSGGMKRRLDLALALVHHPRILFLDEPTTGLDPQSRNALWAEVGRLAKEEGVTVFLTTQYLEEADVLADRVGIIDHGHIVAEGTPQSLKAEIARPTVEIVPTDPEQRDRYADVLRRFGELVQLSPDSVAVRCEHDEYDLAEIIRALDAENLHFANLQLHAPSLDDVFLEKTGRTLEGATAEADAEAEAVPA